MEDSDKSGRQADKVEDTLDYVVVVKMENEFSDDEEKSEEKQSCIETKDDISQQNEDVIRCFQDGKESDDEQALTIDLPEEDFGMVEDTVTIAQLDGKDHHIVSTSSTQNDTNLNKPCSIKFNFISDVLATHSKGASSISSTKTATTGEGKPCKIGKPFKCQLCEERFFTFAQVTKHAAEHATAEDLVHQRKEAGQSGSSMLSQCTTNQKTKKPFKCQLCGEAFFSFGMMTKHTTEHEIEDSQKYDSFRSSNPSLNIDSEASALNRLQEQERSYKCQFCDQSFVVEENLITHEMIHTESVVLFHCEICDVYFHSNEKLELHYDTVHLEGRCQFCSKTFIDKEALSVHRQVHINPTTYKCPICQLTFEKRNQYKSHQRIHFKKESKHVCTHCDKKFFSRHHLECHVRIHLGLRPFKCKFCDKSFVQETHLLVHEKIHTGEKPFQCNYCDRKFAQKTHKQSHERTHTGERPFKCDDCGKAFTQVGNLFKHERVHGKDRGSPKQVFPCQYCDKVFLQKKNVVSHELRHTGERPYKCRFCEKTFIRRDVIRKHERSHPECEGTDIPLYKCRFCAKEYSLEYDLEVHLGGHKIQEWFVCQVCNAEFTDENAVAEHEKTHFGDTPS